MYKKGTKSKKVKQKGKLMAALGNPILANNKKMKITSNSPDSNYA